MATVTSVRNGEVADYEALGWQALEIKAIPLGFTSMIWSSEAAPVIPFYSRAAKDKNKRLDEELSAVAHAMIDDGNLA